MGIERKKWGTVPGGERVELFTLTHGDMTATVTNYGATLVSLTVPDRKGDLADVVLGYDTVGEYVNGRGYFGSMIGRVANRLSGARFTLDGVTYNVDRNKEKYQLHGGSKGFSSKVWKAAANGDRLYLTCLSDDGDSGYPGSLAVTVVYELTDTGLRLECRAATDKATVVTLTNHSYFNLSGDPSTTILDHVATINGHQYLETDADQVPTGRILDVTGTPLDFTRPTVIGSRIDEPFEPLVIGEGYDHFYVIDGSPRGLNLAARVEHPGTGRVLEVRTTQPGVQFYTGNHMAQRINGKGGAVYGRRSGFCLETQGYVDAPNRPEFPPITLRPGETYQHETVYDFSSL